MGVTIGIRREDKNEWERRAPLTPDQVRELVRSHGLTVHVQPSPHRAFPEAAYREAGAVIDDTLAGCSIGAIWPAFGITVRCPPAAFAI